MKKFLTLLDAIIDMISNGSKIRKFNGDGAYDKKDYVGAMRWYTEAIAKNPIYAAAYNGRGLCKVHLGDREGAILDFRLACESGSAEGCQNLTKHTTP